jgi:hypothetical protein
VAQTALVPCANAVVPSLTNRQKAAAAIGYRRVLVNDTFVGRFVSIDFVSSY